MGDFGLSEEKLLNMFPDKDLGPLIVFVDVLPPLISRTSLPQVLPGIIAPKTVQHDENKRRGPRLALHINGRRCYPMRSFLEYLNRKGVDVIKVNDVPV